MDVVTLTAVTVSMHVLTRCYCHVNLFLLSLFLLDRYPLLAVGVCGAGCACLGFTNEVFAGRTVHSSPPGWRLLNLFQNQMVFMICLVFLKALGALSLPSLPPAGLFMLCSCTVHALPAVSHACAVCRVWWSWNNEWLVQPLN